MTQIDARCPLCRARMLAATNRTLRDTGGLARAFDLACASCGLLVEEEGTGDGAPEALRALLAAGDLSALDDTAFGLDAYTARIAATCVLRRFDADDDGREALERPHGPAAARGLLRPFEGEAPVTLGVLCRAGEVDTLRAALRPHAAWAAEIVLVADGAPAPPETLSVEGFAAGAVWLARRPLAGDFAAQRNALHDLSTSPWVMQLDADETLDPKSAALLPALARMGDEDGLVSIGLARRNLVDGAQADVFPDVQYRLNRRAVRFAGRVHERPDRPWQKSTISLHGAIDHHLSRAHVLARSKCYEALAPGRGRLDEAEALTWPYRD